MQGYKVYWNDGCRIRAPIDKRIADCIEQNLEPWTDYRAILQKCRKDSASSKTKDCCFGLSNPEITASMADSYYEAIRTSGLISNQNAVSQNSPNKPKIAYSAMHGVGYPWAKRSFETFQLDPFFALPEQKDANPEFPTVSFPNPEEKGALDLSMAFASKHDCDIVLANDPDADRLAVAEKCRKSGKWTVFTGDQIGVMLGHWIWETIGKDCDKVCTYFLFKYLSFMYLSCLTNKAYIFHAFYVTYLYIYEYSQ